MPPIDDVSSSASEAVVNPAKVAPRHIAPVAARVVRSEGQYLRRQIMSDNDPLDKEISSGPGRLQDSPPATPPQSTSHDWHSAKPC